jgi:putative heme iron utilization protein
MTLANEARIFLRTTHRGILSTFSAKFPGYPFGSVTPFVLDHTGAPIILISSIAEHTKNIIENPKISLVVFAGDEDLQANARLTLLGEAKIIDKSDADLRARYLRYMPQAAGYFDMHDFAFYRIAIQHARYIAGFGKMGWMDEQALNPSSTLSPLASQETNIINHMNQDHADSILAYCAHFHGVSTTQAVMLGIDQDGFDVSIHGNPHEVLRFNFSEPIDDALSARKALVAMSQQITQQITDHSAK